MTINDIYTGNGVSELITMCMQGLCNNGDEVLVPMPDYPLWTASISLAGGKPVHYICDEQSDWNPDIEDIRSKITSKTKAIVIINLIILQVLSIQKKYCSKLLMWLATMT